MFRKFDERCVEVLRRCVKSGYVRPSHFSLLKSMAHLTVCCLNPSSLSRDQDLGSDSGKVLTNLRNTQHRSAIQLKSCLTDGSLWMPASETERYLRSFFSLSLLQYATAF